MGLSLGSYSRIGLALLALLALFVLGRLYVRTPATARLRAAALALVVGGAIGNLGNRLLSPRGATDFIDVGVHSWRFWTLNVPRAGVTLRGAPLVLPLSRRDPPQGGASPHT